MGGLRSLAAGLLALVLLVAAPVRALEPRLFDEFDARLLGEGEKRLLQIGLTAAGPYVGLIDGRWGPASQQAFERYAVANDLADPAGKVSNLGMALLGLEALAFLDEHDLGWRGGEPFGHRMLAPAGPFLPDPDTAAQDLEFVAGGLSIRVMTSDADFASGLHAVFEAGGGVVYQVRKDSRFVTSIDRAGGRVYLRSDWSDRAGAVLTTVVERDSSAPAGLFEVVVGSLALVPGDEGQPLAGFLHAMMTAALDLATEPPPPVAQVAASPPAATPGAMLGTGTAFFVNNHDLVTAAHVVEGCARLARVDGAPLDLVAIHPDLDLALLSASARSRAWIALGGAALLGQRVFALGYPYYGDYGTGLNMTAGNVSAMAGLGDDPEALTITAPVQPGNSGGPLLGRDGRLLGVVVARLDHLKVAEATGSLPENVNYAVEGAALLAFLSAQGVALPPPVLAIEDVEEGLPQALQDAVIPVVRLGP